MHDFPDLPDFLKRKPMPKKDDVYIPVGRTKPLATPQPMYSGTKYIGSLFDYKDGTFSAYLVSGKGKDFKGPTARGDAIAWLSDGHEDVSGPLKATDPVPGTRAAEKSAPRPVALPQGAPPAPKPPRPPKVEGPEIEAAKAKFKDMKMPEIEAWGKRVGAVWEPVAPNAGVLRMRVQNAILVKLRSKSA